MRSTRIYIDSKLEPGLEIKLPANAAQHVQRVLRMKTGDEIKLFNGQCSEEFSATIKLAERKNTTVAVGQANTVNSESPLKIELLQAISSGDKMDFTIQKAVELGVDEIFPIYSSRSVPVFKSDRLKKKQAHWHQIIISASEQSGRIKLAKLHPPKHMLEALLEPARAKNRYLLAPTPESSLVNQAPESSHIQIWVGPEGGFSEKEIETAQKSGIKPTSFGPRILRTETAGMAAIAFLQGKFGDL